MKKIQVYIDSQLADFNKTDEIDITIEKNVDVFEASQSEFTYGIDFPRTERNDRLFGHIGDKMKIDKFTPTYGGEIVINTTSVLKGTAKVREITKRLIRANIISDLRGLLENLSGKSLRDIQSFTPIDFSGAETIDDVVLTKGNNALSDIAFPLVSYGNFYYGQASFDSLNNTDPLYYQDAGKAYGQQNLILGGLFFTDFPPATYVVNILKKIFQDIGYILSGEIIADTEINKLILLYTGEREPQWNWKYLANFSYSYAILQPVFSYIGRYFKDVYAYTPPVSGDYILQLRIDGSKSNADVVNKRRVVLVLQTTPERLESPYQYIKFNNTVPMGDDASVLAYKTALAIVDVPALFSIDYVNANVYLEAGQTVYLCYYGYSDDYVLEANVISLVEFEVSEITDKDELLHIEKNLPDIAQIDFVKSFIKMFNIVTTIDEKTKTVYFNRKSQFYKGIDEKLNINQYANRDNAIETPLDEDSLKKVKYYFDENDFFQKEDIDFSPKHNQSYDEENNIELIFSPTPFRVFWKIVGGSGYQPIVIPSITDQDGINRNVLDATKSGAINYDFAPRIVKYAGIPYTDPMALANEIYLTDFQGTLLDPTAIGLCTLFDRSTQIYYRVDFSNTEQVWKTFYLDALQLQKSRLSAAYLAQNELSLTFNPDWIDINTLKQSFYKDFDNIASSHLLKVEAIIPEQLFIQLTGERLIEFGYDIYYLQSVKKYDPRTGECELQLIKKV